MRIIAISDIHGNFKTFKKLLEEKVIFEKSDKLFLLGDYYHRGPNTEGILKYILKLKIEGYDITCLYGNHELMYLETNAIRGKRLKPYEQNFFDDLVYFAEYDNYIFVHAGLNFKQLDPFTDRYSIVWERNWYKNINYEWLGNRTIVHGHTPITKYEIYRLLDHPTLQAVDIDNGCFRVSYKPNYGNLCALDLTNRELYFQENIDMKR